MEEKILDLLAEICEDDIVKEDLKTELFQSGLLDSLGFAEFLAVNPQTMQQKTLDLVGRKHSPLRGHQGRNGYPGKNPQSCKIQMLTRERQA